MLRIILAILSASFVLMPKTALAQGTLGINEIFELFHNSSRFTSTLSSYEFSCSAWAEIRFGSMGAFPELSGARMGPYEILARPRGATGNWTVNLLIKTKSTFFNASKKTLPNNPTDFNYKLADTTKAVRFEEEVVAVAPRKCEEFCDAQSDQPPCFFSK